MFSVDAFRIDGCSRRTKRAVGNCKCVRVADSVILSVDSGAVDGENAVVGDSYEAGVGILEDAGFVWVAIDNSHVCLFADMHGLRIGEGMTVEIENDSFGWTVRQEGLNLGILDNFDGVIGAA